MTLRELREAHPRYFHPNQDWFDNEPFMDRDSLFNPWLDSTRPVAFCQTEEPSGPLFSAAQLFLLYKDGYRGPDLWLNYLWTSDLDSHGQRVYVGDNGKGFEIHRHIHLTARFGVLLRS